MREIKFRGQTRKKGEKVRIDGTPVDGNWVYGGVRQGKGDFSMIYENETYDKRVVYTDTVCQYTGLKDKNGNKIWENDIVKYTDDLINKEKTVLIEFNETHASFVRLYKSKMGLQYLYINESIANNCEVIGNIFDNPELLDADKQASKYADNDVMKPAT